MVTKSCDGRRELALTAWPSASRAVSPYDRAATSFAHLADLAAAAKAIEVFAAWCQATRLDMDAMTELRTRNRASCCRSTLFLRYDASETIV